MAHPWSELRARLPAEVRERARKKTEAMLAEIERDRCTEEAGESRGAAGVSDAQESIDDVQR
jgi:hypothetical protein